MNTSTANQTGSRRFVRMAAATLAAVTLLGLTACSTTKQVTKGVEPSGFLGDYSMMERGVKDRAVLSYVKPGVNWEQYTKFMIEPVALWAGTNVDSDINGMSDENKQILIDLMHTALTTTVAKSHYQLVDQAGPGVLVVHAALTDAEKSWPVVAFVSSVYLPLKVIGFGKQVITGKFTGVGDVTLECEILDGVSKERLAAVVDCRAGTGAIRSKFNGTWGDVELCCEWWAERMIERLDEQKVAAKEAAAKDATK